MKVEPLKKRKDFVMAEDVKNIRTCKFRKMFTCKFILQYFYSAPTLLGQDQKIKQEQNDKSPFTLFSCITVERDR